MSAHSQKPGWKIVKFGEVVKNANLVERDSEANGIERVVGLEHIDPGNLHIRRWNSIADSTSFTRKFVPGQTLFGKRRAYQHKVAYAEFEGICSSDILTFEPKSKKVLLPQLLPFICQSDTFFDYALGTSAGSLSPRTSWTALKDFEFPLPPLDEQKRIAEILWSADEAHNCCMDLKNHVETVFSLLLASKFPKRSEGTHGFVTLASLCSKLPQSGIYKSEEFLGSGTKIVKMGQLFGNDIIDDSINMDLMELTDDEKGRYRLTNNDLLFGRRSIVLEGAGKCSMVANVERDIVFESSILRVSLDPNKAKSQFVFSWFISPEGKKELRRIRSFTTVAGITGSDLKKVRVPLLPNSKQQEIVELLENHRLRIKNLQSHEESTASLLKSIREFLIGAANV